MRTEPQMMALLTALAGDDRIRAAFLNGSRSHTLGPQDDLRDYDIVYTVADTRPFIEDKAWLAPFGPITVCQQPDLSPLYNDGDPLQRYGFLVIFADGVRVDFSFQTVEYTLRTCTQESGVLLVDKDGILPPLPTKNPDYAVKCPTQEEFTACCNEFWWVSTYIAKGLRRRQLLFAADHLEQCVRPMLRLCLQWRAAQRMQWNLVPGKCDKYLPLYLTEQENELLARTYPALQVQAIWQALFAAAQLMGVTARSLAQTLAYTYDLGEEERTLAYLHRMQAAAEE